MTQPSTPRRQAVRTSLLLTLLVLLATAGCASSSSQAEQSGRPSASASDEQAPTVSEEPATAQPEDTDSQEAAAAGGGGVSIQLVGLPVGGGGATAVGDAWCQVLSWRTQLPESVSLDIDAVTILEPGATLDTAGCDRLPACAGSAITGDAPSCAVLVRPPSPQTPALTVRLDGTLRCPSQPTCQAVGATGGDAFTVFNPGGGETDGGGAETSPSVDAVDDGLATPLSTP
jgi:hypothetical protein